MALTKRLVIIGTVAANAPYIGLLGGFGIMMTFIRWDLRNHGRTIMIGLELWP